MFVILFFILQLSTFLFAKPQSFEELHLALELSAQIDKKLQEGFPATFNHIFSTGYFVTHSARMTEIGSMGIGVAKAPPYLNWNARIQPFSHLEFSANYRIFCGFEDPNLGHFGFGDYADRGANFKFAIFTPEESLYLLPGLAFGIDDFMGSKKFTSYYVVGTQVLQNSGVEISAGWGIGQYTHGPSRGFFGGVNWFPFYGSSNRWIKGFGLTLEYDPTNYNKDPYPAKIVSNTPLNFGGKYTLGQYLAFSACCLRGNVFSASSAACYTWGKNFGFIPKIGDPEPYTFQSDSEPLGCSKTNTVMINQINEALKSQGFQLFKAWQNECKLWLIVINKCYRYEHIVRMRIQSLLAALIPENISEVVVILESDGLLCQQYEYSRDFLLNLACQRMGYYEFDLLTPKKNVSLPPKSAELLFKSHRNFFCSRVAPRIETFFGNARGKFKYDLGVKASCEGFFFSKFLYDCQISYTVLSTLKDVSDFDFLHPSQLPNVATDYVRYRQQSAFTWDALYLQKSWNLGKGFFTRVAGGYFQVNYGGLAAEFLWYPAQSCFAIGLEGSIVKKRSYSGLGFQSTLRQFEGTTAVYRHYATLEQYFIDFYFDFPGICFFSKISVGQFLARDKGFRFELTRYFESGLRLTGWITMTDAHDVMHGETYFDRGIALELPLDLFSKCSHKRTWNYAMAAWLRDAGYATSTGRPLFNTINRERRW